MEADNLLGDNVEGDNMQDVKHTNVSVIQNLDAGASQEPGPANVESEQGGEFVAHDDMGQPIEDEPTPVTEIVHSSDLQSLLAQNAWLSEFLVHNVRMYIYIYTQHYFLAHTNQNLEEELTDIREKFKELSAKNSELQSQVTSSANDLNERSRLYRQLESARNDLAIKKIQLDCDVEKLKHEKEERDTAVKTLTKEKHLLATENFGLKDQLQQISNEKAALHLEKKTQEQEIRTMNFERERARLDKDMFAESKKWFLQEIAERDSKVSQLRIEMSSKELSWQRERLSLNDDIARLQLIAEEHEAQIQLKKSRTEELIARIEEISAEHRQALSDMEAELRSKTELANLYKDSLEKSEHVAAELNEQWQAREGLFEETKQVLVEVRQEMEEEKKAQQEEISSRDAQIAELKDELQKANDLLKSKHAVHLNVTEEELSVLSPAAAETARLLKGGQSLTSIIREHARLAGKLAESREQNRQLELTMREMRAPQLLHQKDVLDQTFDQNNRLQDQLKDADEQRRRLEGQRDAANRELAFTRAELEKYQRDHAKLGKQLQKRNMQLESELASERALAAQAMQSAQNSELDRLKRDLKRAQIGEANLKTELDQMNTTFRTLREQAESLKKLAEDNVSAAEARASKLKAEDAVSQARASEMKVSRLEEHIKLLKDEKEKVERIQEDRVARSEQIVAEVKMTNARLETSFEMQKQTAAAVVKELEKVQKECDQIRSENDRLRSVDVQHAAEIQKLHSEMMELQGKYSEYK
uniref:TPR_MLP1_2 domain-containing protein n=1 Tax=Heterorhabditis bacteriophora TaxID=37862 RepID=A0A1I7XDM0_HETBA